MGLPLDLINESENFRGANDGVYPDNEQSVRVFNDMMTQWRSGPGGVIGLDYNPLRFVFKVRKVKRSARGRVFSDIQVMERSALSYIKQNQGS